MRCPRMSVAEQPVRAATRAAGGAVRKAEAYGKTVDISRLAARYWAVRTEASRKASFHPRFHGEEDMPLQAVRRLSFVLGLLSCLAIIAAHLALTDIYRGEADVTLEWNVVRISFLIIVAFHVSALVVITRAKGRQVV